MQSYGYFADIVKFACYFVGNHGVSVLPFKCNMWNRNYVLQSKQIVFKQDIRIFLISNKGFLYSKKSSPFLINVFLNNKYQMPRF